MTAESGGNHVPNGMELIEDNQEAIKRWIEFCRKHGSVICREYEVPQGILPPAYNGVLIDVKVGGKKRVPDDKIYLAHEELRARVARGNCVLELNRLENGRIAEKKYIFLVFALKKFSGGLGDEDDSNSAQSQWTHYFIKDISAARKVIATTKENGEAAHISARKLFSGQTYFCTGSKNVHMLVRNKDDIQRYTDSRFSYARSISTAFFENYMDSLEISQSQKDNFVDFMSLSRCTAVLEVLQPDHQHVVNLSYLKQAELKFICWTSPDLDEDFQSTTLTQLPADAGIDKAREFGLVTTDYEVVTIDGNPVPVIEEYMLNIRKGHGSEGKVLYFMDSDNCAIGVIKKKTAWYIILRALREKVATFSSSKKSHTRIERIASIKKRIKAIQVWLGFSKAYADGWTEIAVGFAMWVEDEYKGGNIRDHFPVAFENYLQAHDATVRVKYNKLLDQFDAKSAL